ncbi:MAG: hypothetical protein PHY34_01935 [Patescibacteria group bacterium]|nr:hypothetical protein [Patescibacteria group bacterium]MDD5715305.1 hypothetical protein [Patescibacteria group bacterium]
MTNLNEAFDRVYNKLIEKQKIYLKEIDIQVLKDHAFVESVMDLIIQLNVDNNPDLLEKKQTLKDVLAELRFIQKVKIIKKIFDDKELNKQLENLNKFRNLIAHISELEKTVSYDMEIINTKLANTYLHSVNIEYWQSAATLDALNGLVDEKKKSSNPSKKEAQAEK